MQDRNGFHTRGAPGNGCDRRKLRMIRPDCFAENESWCTRTLMIVLLSVCCGSVSPANAQDPAAPAVTAPPVEESAKPSLPTIAELTAQREALAKNTELDEKIRLSGDEQLQKTIENLQTAEQSLRQTTELAKELETAPGQIDRLQAQLAQPAESQVPADSNSIDKSLDAVTAKLKAATDAQAGLRVQSQQVNEKIDLRNTRRPMLAELKTKAEQALQDVAQQQAAPPPAGEPAQITEWRTTRLLTRQLMLRREIALLEQETRTYEATTRYWMLVRDLADRNQQEATRAVQFWQQQAAEARQRQAEMEVRAARVAAAQSLPAVRKQAERNAELAEQNTELVKDRAVAQSQLDTVDKSLRDRVEAFKSLQDRSETAEYSQAIGVLLRNQRASLPDIADLRFRAADRHSQISDMNLKLIEWETERRTLIDVTSATAQVIQELDYEDSEIDRAEIEQQLTNVLGSRQKLLGDLIENGKAQLDILVRLDVQERRFIAAVEEEANWLAEHVLWVRSTGLIGTQPEVFLAAATSLVNGTTWAHSWKTLREGVQAELWLLSLMAMAAALLMLIRSGAKRRLREYGRIAERPNCTEFRVTLWALMLTLVLALPLPFLAWFFGERLASMSRGDDAMLALANAIQLISVCWAVIELIRQFAQPHGLAESHLDWSSETLDGFRRAARFLLVTLLPLLLFVGYAEALGDDQIAATLGRLAYIAAMACVEVSLYRMLHPSSPVFAALMSDHGEAPFLWRTRWIWASALAFSPIVLIVVSALGYHYTAMHLTGRVAATLGVGFGTVFVTSFLTRWLLVTYRKLAIRRGRELREQIQNAAPVDPSHPVPVDKTPTLRLKDVNSQAQKLIRMTASMAAAAGLYMIWVDVLPALGILRNIELWQNSLIDVGEDHPAVWVTAADLFIAVIIAAITLFASRNLPGLLEITVLQRLPLDAGARYAASTVSRYLIVLIGFLMGFRAIGVGWSSVQWLVAAMTVGLGFGLQEIFANFVSGIILLFERPVRVGDTVTIGEVTGAVTRIQIRATTVLDWDNKELIVPNREFVTGNVVNWTLSSPTLRIVQRVGIAYGSDTRLATDVLYQVAREHPQVLAEPEPVVVFTEFGDSTLNFELRVFVSGLAHFRRARHELNTAIHERFRDNHIEIAFPQRDLHVRSVSSDLLQALEQVRQQKRQLGDDADRKQAD